MQEMELFERASRWKLRFPTPVGQLVVEDLWELPLTSNKDRVANLNDLAKALNRALKAVDEEDFVNPGLVETNRQLETAFEIVKHIIAVRLVEQEAAKKAKETRDKKQMILAVIAEKEAGSLKEKGIDELRALLESL